MSPRRRAPRGAGRSRRTPADAPAARRCDPRTFNRGRDRSTRAIPFATAGPGAPRDPKGSASLRLRVPGARAVRQESPQHSALGVVDAVLEGRARSRGNPGRVAHARAPRARRERDRPARPPLLSPTRAARCSRARMRARGDPGRWRPRAGRRAARAPPPARRSPCRCRRPRRSMRGRGQRRLGDELDVFAANRREYAVVRMDPAADPRGHRCP